MYAAMHGQQALCNKDVAKRACMERQMGNRVCAEWMQQEEVYLMPELQSLRPFIIMQQGGERLTIAIRL